MNKYLKNILLLSMCPLLLSGCNSNKNVSISATIHKDAKFDCVDLDVDENDFTNAGFSFGDSVDIKFSNGLEITDVPYFNGYYVKTGETLVCAYPNNGYVLIGNNNRDFWTPNNFEDGMMVEITLNTSSKYKATYEALSQSYSVNRSDYDSDEEFANFRSISGGNLKENFIYRGASPVDNSRNRASIVNNLLEINGIECILDLADSSEEMEEYFNSDNFDSNYTKTLYEEGKDITLSMSSNFESTSNKESLAEGLRHLMKYGGPCYIHCMEGKDRTGFVCLLLEALASSTYEEMRDDYMTTYKNYYGITEDNSKDKYDAIVSLYFDGFLENLSGFSGDELKTIDYTSYAKAYLNSCKMTEEEINDLVTLICK